jgi:hypothetical protein
MTSVSRVNVLAAGETLTFGYKLTVVYEPNDTGMLGDVRLAKKKQIKPTEIEAGCRLP